MRHPCLTCPHHLSGGEKGAGCCIDCRDRVAYVRAVEEGDGLRRVRADAPEQSVTTRIRPYQPDRSGDLVKLINCKGEQPMAIPVPPKTRICNKADCAHGGKPQPWHHFYDVPGNRDGKAKECNDCRNRRQKLSRQRKKERLAAMKTNVRTALGRPEGAGQTDRTNPVPVPAATELDPGCCGPSSSPTSPDTAGAGGPANPMQRLAGLLAAGSWNPEQLAEIGDLCREVAENIETFMQLRAGVSCRPVLPIESSLPAFGTAQSIPGLHGLGV
jgi:hypothetical protein